MIKRCTIEIVIAFLLNAVLGTSVLLEGSVLPEHEYLTKILALLVLYVFIVEIFYFLFYIVVALTLRMLGLRFLNAFLGVGLVDLIIRLPNFSSKYVSMNSFLQWVFMPSFVMISIGIAYLIYELRTGKASFCAFKNNDKYNK